MAESLERIPEPQLMDDPAEAAAYDQADFADVNARFVGRLVSLVGEHTGLHVIDLGSGPADIPIRIARATDWHVTAVEAAPAMVDLARKNISDAGLADRVVLHARDATDTRLPGLRWDAVISNSLLHHLSDPMPMWHEIRRLIRPGGWILVRDLVRPRSESALRFIVDAYAGSESELLREEFARSLRSAYTVDEVRQQVREAGLGGLVVAMASDRHLDVFGKML
jgi:ubiquinone/menaquinone biosynthesis C-methylase UbiE